MRIPHAVRPRMPVLRISPSQPASITGLLPTNAVPQKYRPTHAARKLKGGLESDGDAAEQHRLKREWAQRAGSIANISAYVVLGYTADADDADRERKTVEGNVGLRITW